MFCHSNLKRINIIHRYNIWLPIPSQSITLPNTNMNGLFPREFFMSAIIYLRWRYNDKKNSNIQAKHQAAKDQWAFFQKGLLCLLWHTKWQSPNLITMQPMINTTGLFSLLGFLSLLVLVWCRKTVPGKHWFPITDEITPKLGISLAVTRLKNAKACETGLSSSFFPPSFSLFYLFSPSTFFRLSFDFPSASFFFSKLFFAQSIGWQYIKTVILQTFQFTSFCFNCLKTFRVC